MADNVSGLFERGQTYNGPNKTLSSSYGQSVGIEGHVKSFKDMAIATTSGVRTKRSDRTVKCIAVRNTSGFTLLPKRLVAWEAGYEGKRVAGYARTTSERVAGVVDEHLSSAGVRDEDVFWLQVSGPTMCLMPVGATIDVAAGDFMECLTAATTNCTTAGRPRPLPVTSNQTEIKAQILNTIGRAMSAVSSSSTNTNVLVDLSLLQG